MTAQGIKERYGDLDDGSDEAADEQIDWKLGSAKQMKELFDYQKLNESGKTSWDLWEYQAKQSEEGREFRRNGYVFEQMSAFHSFIPLLMINYHSVDNKQEMEAYISRLTTISAFGIRPK